MGAPESLQRPEEMPERHHRAFLLYAMQDPDAEKASKRRSLRAVARALNASDNSVRKWRDKEGWEDRLGDPEHSRHAGDLYAKLYHSKLGGREVAVLKERLIVPYQPPGEEQKTELAKSVDLYEQVDRETAQQLFNKESTKRNQRLKQVLDGVLVRVGLGLKSGEIKPKPSDIGTVIRGVELLERSEARRLAMMPSSEDSDRADPVATSQRVLQAEANGSDVLEAMVEDTQELLLILKTLQTHRTESNVIPMDPALRAAKGTG